MPWMVDTPRGGCAGIRSIPTTRPPGRVLSTATCSLNEREPRTERTIGRKGESRCNAGTVPGTSYLARNPADSSLAVPSPTRPEHEKGDQVGTYEIDYRLAFPEEPMLGIHLCPKRLSASHFPALAYPTEDPFHCRRLDKSAAAARGSAYLHQLERGPAPETLHLRLLRIGVAALSLLPP